MRRKCNVPNGMPEAGSTEAPKAEAQTSAPAPGSNSRREFLKSGAGALGMATIAGAAGSGLLDKIGTLTPGKEADIVVLDANTIAVAPMNNVPDTIVTMMDTRNVRHVMIAGKVVFKDFKLVGWDEKKLVWDLMRARDRVLARINSKPLVGAIPKGLNSFSNPYRPNFFDSCCHIGLNTTAPQYKLRP